MNKESKHGVAMKQPLTGKKINLPLLFSLWLSLGFILIFLIGLEVQKGWTEETNNKYNELIVKAERYSTVRVIVGLKMSNYQPEGKLSKEAAEKQRDAIAQLQDKLLNSLVGYKVTSVKKFDAWIPAIAIEIDKEGLMVLISNPDVSTIEEDVAVPPNAPAVMPKKKR